MEKEPHQLEEEGKRAFAAGRYAAAARLFPPGLRRDTIPKAFRQAVQFNPFCPAVPPAGPGGLQPGARRIRPSTLGSHRMDEWELPSGHRNIADVVLDLGRRITGSSIRLVSIDGWSGSGKTTLAMNLADRLGLRRYELDEYLHEHRGSFLEHLDYLRLSTALAGSQTAHGPVLVDGICVLEVLGRLGLRSDLKVYVRRISASGIWHDGLRLDSSRTVEEVLEEERQSAARWAEIHSKKFGEGSEPLAWEVVRYHYRYMPHENADVYFNRIEDAA